MRVVHLSHDMEAIGRLFSGDRALEAARERRDRTYDPALADLFVAHGRGWFDRLRETEPWDAVLALEPEPRRTLDGEALDEALAVAADFIDLKSPYMGGHSRRCAQLAADAARVLGLPTRRVTALRRAALVHDFGITAVPNSIWDKPGSLTRAEFDRVELHPMLTEQMLRRSPALAVLNPVASAHHEKCDGSGYHKRVRADTGDPAACVLAATEIYVGLTTERADRPPFSDADAAAELRRLEAQGVIEARASRAVLVAAGHGEPAARTRKRPQNPGGLSRREVDVLRLAARGLTTRADRRSALHLTQDRRSPHPAHLRQDRRLDPRRRRAMGDAARSRRLSDGSQPGRRSGRSRSRDQRRNLTTGGQVRCCHRVRAVRAAAVPGRSESGSAAMNASTTYGSNWVAAWRRSSAIARAAGIARR